MKAFRIELVHKIHINIGGTTSNRTFVLKSIDEVGSCVGAS